MLVRYLLKTLNHDKDFKNIIIRFSLSVAELPVVSSYVLSNQKINTSVNLLDIPIPQNPWDFPNSA